MWMLQDKVENVPIVRSNDFSVAISSRGDKPKLPHISDPDFLFYAIDSKSWY